MFLLLILFGCEKEDIQSIPKIEGLSLYWDHEVFGEEGRRLRFEMTTTNEYNNDYEFEFNTSIKDKTITARLEKSINNGNCQYFPMPSLDDDDPNKCNANGSFYLLDKELNMDNYSLKIITPTFEVTSELNITDEKVMLDIPINKHLKSSIKEVYPIPKNLLFGSIIYQGSNNTSDAEEFLNYLTSLGLFKTTVPNYPYRHLNVEENGYPATSTWEPDNHSIKFLYNLNNVDFNTIFEKSKEYFNQTNLNIYLYTSFGDQSIMSKTDGITVVFAN